MKKYYFINKFDTNIIDKQSTNTGIIYRNYNSKNNVDILLNLEIIAEKKVINFFFQIILS